MRRGGVRQWTRKVRLRFPLCFDSQELGTKTLGIESCTGTDVIEILVVVEQKSLSSLLDPARPPQPVLNGADDHCSPQPSFRNVIGCHKITIAPCSHYGHKIISAPLGNDRCGTLTPEARCTWDPLMARTALVQHPCPACLRRAPRSVIPVTEVLDLVTKVS